MATSTVTKTQLTPMEIRNLLSNGRAGRGTYKTSIITFVRSNDISVNFMELVEFTGKKVDAVYASVTNQLKVLRLENPEWPQLALHKIPGDGTAANPAMVLLVNMDLLTGALTEDSE